jgi:hypothetical protein
MATIIQTSENTYSADNGRGTSLTIVKKGGGWWEVHSANAATRAWRSLGVKVFWELADIEKAYKTFRGIAALIQ